MADGTRLQQVLWNLLKNALKFTPAGGNVTISTRNESDDVVVLDVADTGGGIRPEVLPHVFNSFEQGDARGKHRYGDWFSVWRSLARLSKHTGEPLLCRARAWDAGRRLP